MPFEGVIRSCVSCNADLPDDAVCIEEGMWWIQAEGRLVCNPKLACGPFATDFVRHLQDSGVPAAAIFVAIEQTAMRRFKAAFPSCRVRTFQQCGEVGFPLTAEKGGGK